jgi:hypothetical protein
MKIDEHTHPCATCSNSVPCSLNPCPLSKYLICPRCFTFGRPDVMTIKPVTPGEFNPVTKKDQ